MANGHSRTLVSPKECQQDEQNRETHREKNAHHAHAESLARLRQAQSPERAVEQARSMGSEPPNAPGHLRQAYRPEGSGLKLRPMSRRTDCASSTRLDRVGERRREWWMEDRGCGPSRLIRHPPAPDPNKSLPQQSVGDASSKLALAGHASNMKLRHL